MKSISITRLTENETLEMVETYLNGNISDFLFMVAQLNRSQLLHFFNDLSGFTDQDRHIRNLILKDTAKRLEKVFNESL